MPRKHFRVADLFSGAGGASFGFHAHPSFRVIYAADQQVGKPSYGVGTLECNSTFAANIGIEPCNVDLAKYEPTELLSDAGIKRGQWVSWLSGSVRRRALTSIVSLVAFSAFLLGRPVDL